MLHALLPCALAAIGILSSVPPAWRLGTRVIARRRAAGRWRQCLAAPGAPGTGKCAAWVTVPAARLDTLVLNRASAANLGMLPCTARRGTALSGEPCDGLSLVMAHRDTHFRGLRLIRPGHTISLQRTDGSHAVFVVKETEILSPDRAASRISEKAGEPWLVLMTCHPFYYVGPAPNRFLVWAYPSGPPS